jgi:hypothetical protein
MYLHPQECSQHWHNEPKLKFDFLKMVIDETYPYLNFLSTLFNLGTF